MALEAQRREEVAARIRQLRGPRTQQAIADRVGVTLRAYQAWEAGGGITWENVELLAGVLGVSEEYLLYGGAGDEARQGTRFERIEAKLDALLRALDVDPAAITVPHHGSDPRDELEEELRVAGEEHAPRGADSDPSGHARRRAARAR